LPIFTSLKYKRKRGEYNIMPEIRLKKGETIDKALRRLKKKLDREGTLRDVRNRRFYEKPGDKKRRKEKTARFNMMIGMNRL